MRITGGSHRGRRIAVPPGRNIRPTADRAREGVFNILANGLGLSFSDISILDLYAGTGALGFEALSRGAQRATFVDNSATSLKAIKSNIEALGFDDCTSVIKSDARRLPPLPSSTAAMDLVFLDPPYDQQLLTPALQALVDGSWLTPNAICVLERRRSEDEWNGSDFDVIENRTYGEAAFQFLGLNQSSAPHGC